MSIKRVYIVNNISEGGAIKSFTDLLIQSIKSISNNSIIILNKEKIFKNKFIEKIISLILNKFFYKINIQKKIKYIENLDKEIILIVPYVIQNECKFLDLFYEEIAKRKFILVIHDLHIFNYPDKWNENVLFHVKKRYFNLIAKASKIIVHNEFTKKDVLHKFNYNSKDIMNIWLPPFININNFKKNDLIISKYNFTNSPYAIWPSSSTSFHKNHDNLLKAWAILISKGVKLKIIFTGNKSPRWNELNSLISDLNLENYVHFTGVIPEIDLSQLINNAKFTICPTLFEGGGPVPAAESVLLKTPVLLSNISQCKELMNNNLDDNYYFNPNDPVDISNKIEYLLNNYEFAKNYFSKFSDYYIKSRTWENSAIEYSNIINIF